jgi:hypothetical protein
MTSRPQQETDLWIGQTSFGRSLMTFPLFALKLPGLLGLGAHCRQAVTIRARGQIMSNLDKVVLQLRKERDEVQKRVGQLDQALAALGSLDGLQTRGRSLQTSGRKRRTMSAAARKRIAAAQRARWAKWKAAKGLRKNNFT